MLKNLRNKISKLPQPVLVTCIFLSILLSVFSVSAKERLIELGQGIIDNVHIFVLESQGNNKKQYSFKPFPSIIIENGKEENQNEAVNYSENQTRTIAMNDIIFNEIAWMGTQVHHSDEWIELYNNTNYLIDLTGWTIEAIDGRPKIKLSGQILANSFFLLERTDDNTILGIIANQFYTGALGNSGEILELRDSQGNLIDEVICIKENGACKGWQGGDNKTKQTMIRNINLNWQTSSNPEGTPKALND